MEMQGTEKSTRIVKASACLILEQSLVVEVHVRRVDVVELHILEVGLQLRLNVIDICLSPCSPGAWNFKDETWSKITSLQVHKPNPMNIR